MLGSHKSPANQAVCTLLGLCDGREYFPGDFRLDRAEVPLEYGSGDPAIEADQFEHDEAFGVGLAASGS
jgi:hypothetical protein